MAVRGVPELLAKLNRASDALGGPGLMPAMRAGGDLLVSEIQEWAPVLTSDLKRSYHHEDGAVSDTRAQVLVGTDVEYAPYQEFGTRYQPGTPHVRPALETAADAILAEIVAAAEALLGRAL